MKDPADQQTAELFPAPEKKRRGRPPTGKAKTNAQRQEMYRWRRANGIDGDYRQRLDMYIATEASFALARLASYYGKSEREILEELIKAHEAPILKQLDIDAPEWDAYFNKTLQVTNNKRE